MVTKIAITGNIASGKSQLEEVLISMGYPVYDSDKIAHKVLDSISGFEEYDVFTDGKIDRKKLGKLVFSDAKLRKKLEQMTHPKIKEEILLLFEKHREDKYIFVSVPLLYEAGFDNIFDKVLFVSVDKDIQLKRLMARNNLTEEEALQRISSQISEESKIKKADFIICNNTTINDLSEAVKHFTEKL